jgi:hypothetical protein
MSASGIGRAPETHPNTREINPEAAREGGGGKLEARQHFGIEDGRCADPQLGDWVAELLDVGYVVAPNADDFRARREEPLRRRSRLWLRACSRPPP